MRTTDGCALAPEDVTHTVSPARKSETCSGLPDSSRYLVLVVSSMSCVTSVGCLRRICERCWSIEATMKNCSPLAFFGVRDGDATGAIEGRGPSSGGAA